MRKREQNLEAREQELSMKEKELKDLEARLKSSDIDLVRGGARALSAPPPPPFRGDRIEC